jgi:hypothetical protein
VAVLLLLSSGCCCSLWRLGGVVHCAHKQWRAAGIIHQHEQEGTVKPAAAAAAAVKPTNMSHAV